MPPLISIPEKATIDILNIKGQLIKSQQCIGNNEAINVEDFSNGIYIIKLMTDKEIVTKKFIKY